MSMQRVVVVCLNVLFAVTAVSAGAAVNEITLKVTGAQITATGITPHGGAFFFGAVRGRQRFTPYVARVEKLVTDDDGDGVVTFDYKSAVPADSVWSVVDTTDGRRATATPGGPAVPLVLNRDPVVANNGQLKQIVLSMRSAQLIIVRPGVGIWGQVLVDGNTFDTDGRGDGRITGDISRSIASDGKKKDAPQKFEKGDVVVLIDPFAMQVYSAEVGAKQ